MKSKTVKPLFLLSFLLLSVWSLASDDDFMPSPATNLIRHSYFSLSYNEKYEQANWVYYVLTDDMVVRGGQERSSSFKMDKMVATGSAKSADYTKSGYDRGHLCPAADMDFEAVAMQESFLMSNISPQSPDFNRGIWKELEEQVREWAKKEGKIYIVTGPVFKENKGVIGQEEVLVPGYFYKVLYDATDSPKMIAFVLPNEKSNRPLTDYAVSVDRAEELTGLDFFQQLPDNIESQLEGAVQLGGWFPGYHISEKPLAVKTEPVKTTQKSDSQFYLILAGVLVAVILLVTIRSAIRKRKN